MAATLSRLRSSSARFCMICDCRVTNSCSKSSADPPGGNTRSPAAIRLSTSSAPRTIRILRFESRVWPLAPGPWPLEFLGIAHHHPVTPQGLILRRRRHTRSVRRSEQRRILKVLQKLEHLPGVLYAHFHIQRNFVARVDLRKPHLNQPDVIGLHSFDVGVQFGPANRF